MITRSEYMKNSSELHHVYYSQFITPSTIDFVKTQIGMKKLLKSKDERFNDVAKISHNGAGTWIWDFTPVNLQLMRECEEVSLRGRPSQSTHTCVGKAAARQLVEQYHASQPQEIRQ